jgi:hypothetical protein
MINHISKSKHPDIRRLQQNICPKCNKSTIRNITGKKEISHLSDCGMHVYYKEYSGFECQLFGLSNKTFRIVK